MRFNSLDIFCHIIDNFGDAGIVYRFAKEFKLTNPGCRIRVFCDDLLPLSAVCPFISTHTTFQSYDKIMYLNTNSLSDKEIQDLSPADVLIEAFGCEVPRAYLQYHEPLLKVWINLEYLSAETFVEGYHKKQSLLGNGCKKKYFFMPGFTKSTGGVIIDTYIQNIKQELQRDRSRFLMRTLSGFSIPKDHFTTGFFASIFTYTKNYTALLNGFALLHEDVYLCVCGNKSQHAMTKTLATLTINTITAFHFQYKNITLLFLPFLPQQEYDSLLCCMDFNIVRGEDSLVRAILAEKPFLWNAYIQENAYQTVKVEAFCEMMRLYFNDTSTFSLYKKAMMCMNAPAFESMDSIPEENFDDVLSNLNKIEHAVKGLSYFIADNCSLIDNITDFLQEL